MPSAIPCSLSPLISRIHSFLFLDWRHNVSSKFFDTQAHSISTKKLVPPRLRCNRHSVLLSSTSSGLAASRIRLAAPADTRPRTLLISLCTVQQRTLCTARSLATLCFFTTSGPGPGEFPGFWGSMVFRHTPIPRKGSGNNKCGYPCHNK